ncbi:MAG: glycosyltransferase [Candidatus Binatia bacterium]
MQIGDAVVRSRAMGVKTDSASPRSVVNPVEQRQHPDRSWIGSAWRRVKREVRGVRHRMILEPVRDLSATTHAYRVTGPHPEFRLRSHRGAPPSGWVAFAYQWHGGKSPNRLAVLVDTEAAQPERYLLPACHPSAPVMLHLPSCVHGMRLQPPASVDHFEFGSLQIIELGATQMARGLLRPYGHAVFHEPGMVWHFCRRGLEVLLGHGFRELQATLTLRFTRRPEQLYSEWVRRYDTPNAGDESAARRQLTQLRLRPSFTVIVYLDDRHLTDFVPALRALQNQWYPEWELVLVAAPSLPDDARAAVRRLSSADARIRLAEAAAPSNPCDAMNQALVHATGAFCARVDAQTVLASHALLTMAIACDAHPDAAMLYSDEDRIDSDGRRHTPAFKPDWNPDLLCNQPYIGQLALYRTSLLRDLGGWRAGRDGLEDWDLALRASAVIAHTQICHLPHVLCHQRREAAAGAADVTINGEATRRILAEHLERLGVAAEVSNGTDGGVRIRYALGTPPPLVSIIIPTRNGKPLLQRCVTALRDKTTYGNLELLIVDNRSDDPATLAYLKQLEAQPNVRVLRFDQPFNFSAVNNFAAAQARGAILALLNDDMEVITPDWLSEMAGHALRREVGAVGAKLYYPDGRIQHAGVVLGLGKLAGHAYRGLPEPDAGPNVRTSMVHDVSAVTGACLVLRAEVYHGVGGLDVDLPIAYGDVDFCLRLSARGYRIVWTPHAQLYHWESATRGLDHSPDKVRRLRREQALMQRRWGSVFDTDPAYNPNLTLAAPGFAPAFPPRVAKPWARC